MKFISESFLLKIIDTAIAEDLGNDGDSTFSSKGLHRKERSFSEIRNMKRNKKEKESCSMEAMGADYQIGFTYTDQKEDIWNDRI